MRKNIGIKNACRSLGRIGFTMKPSERFTRPLYPTAAVQLPLPPDVAPESDFLLVELEPLDALEESELVLLLSEEAAFL